jgi:peptidoglycan/xylan/chitin deacetylase (PgdA/CDA1 family)
LITQLSDCVGVPLNVQTLPRTLHPDELIELASSELLEIGSHSLTHPILTAIPTESVQAEVQRSKALLEDAISKPVTKFSYPDGATSRAVQAEVMSAGYTCACSSQSDVASKSSNLFGLPRIWPLNRNGEEFAHWLETWAND